jgi:hypothetical protein
VAVMDGDQCLGDDGYGFTGWSTGLPQIHNYVVPAVNSTINATFSATGACGTCGQFLSFDGVDDEVVLAPFTLTGDFTIEFWLRPLPGFTSGDAILGDASTHALDLAGGKLRLYSGSPRLISAANMVANQWNHYAVVRSGSTLSVLVNGVADASAISLPFSGPITFSGMGRGPFTGRLAGGLDELRIWNVARTPTQVQAARSIVVDPATPGLNAYWRFDQEAGDQVVQDLAPNLRQGICGGTLLPEASDPAFSPTNGPMQYACSREVDLAVHALLQGAYPGSGTVMNDQLRSAGLLPNTEPYTALGFDMAGGSGATASAGVLTVSGPNAVVDWVLVELRDALQPTTLLRTIPGLLQRDGDIVATNGSGPLRVTVDRGAYHVAVRHRNHLGVMTADAVPFTAGLIDIDLRSTAVANFGTNAQNVQNGLRFMVPGDVNGDGVVRYTGSGNDRDLVLQAIGGAIPTNIAQGYSTRDVNLDGIIRYTGTGNDRDRILLTVGGSVPTGVRVEQLP